MTEPISPYPPPEPEQDEAPAAEASSTSASTLLAPSDRRGFLRRASALTLAIPGLGAAIASCSTGESPGGSASAGGQQGRLADTTRAQHDSLRLRNPDSKLDTSLHREMPRDVSTTTPAPNAQSTPFVRYDPTLPPLSTSRELNVHFHSREVPVRISPDTVVAGWTFEGNIPGPIVHCRVGDTVSYSDPFGLKVCYRGSASQVRELKKGTEDATGTSIQLDRNNCVDSYTPTGEEGFDEIQDRFGLMVASEMEFGVEFGDPRQYFYSNFDELRNTAVILRGDYEGGFYSTGNRFTCAMIGGLSNADQTLGGLVAHELIGHGAGVVISGAPAPQSEAIRIENLYHAARGQRARCQGGR